MNESAQLMFAIISLLDIVKDRQLTKYEYESLMNSLYLGAPQKYFINEILTISASNSGDINE